MSSFLFLIIPIFLLLNSCVGPAKKVSDTSGQEYSIGDIRPFFRVKTIYYFDDEDRFIDVTKIPFIPLKNGRAFGYNIPLKSGVPAWKIKEVLKITCSANSKSKDSGKVVERVLEWEIKEGGREIHSPNEFEASDCPGKYHFQVYVQGFLADEFEVFVQ